VGGRGRRKIREWGWSARAREVERYVMQGVARVARSSGGRGGAVGETLRLQVGGARYRREARLQSAARRRSVRVGSPP